MLKRRLPHCLNRLSAVRQIFAAYQQDPAHARQVLRNLSAVCRALRFVLSWNDSPPLTTPAADPPSSANPLWDYFSDYTQGRGIFKWQHYFDIYHRHLGRFVGQPVHLVEVGVHSGGSLEMWAAYLGDQCQVYGVDIEAECATHAHDNISVHIGDQQDPRFWADFKRRVLAVDILIDDGGHRAEQQIVTLEEMLPHLRPGGVYICEDILGGQSAFAAYASGLVYRLNQTQIHGNRSTATEFQQAVYAVHFYPFLMVIEKSQRQRLEFIAQTQGSVWLGNKQPGREP